MTEKDTKVISALEAEIKKITNKENNLYFYVYDTKGTPSQSLYYIYDLALQCHELGYKVKMLYGDKEFVGVEKWLGKDYSDLPHDSIEKDAVPLSVSDVLFIPEINANVMAAVKNKKEVLCKKVAILTSMRYLSDIMRPIGTTWVNLEISECIAMTEALAESIKSVFPSVRTHVVRPRINKAFTYDPSKPKPLVVNIISKTSEHANSIVNNLHWRYKPYGFLAIRELKGLSLEDQATALRDSFLTVWLDTDTEFGLEALEAMACGSIVAGKIPENTPEWMTDEKGDLKDNGIWFTKNSDIQDVIASAVQTYLYDEMPKVLYEEMKNTVNSYNSSVAGEDVKKIIGDDIVGKRIKEFELLISGIENNKEKETETE